MAARLYSPTEEVAYYSQPIRYQTDRHDHILETFDEDEEYPDDEDEEHGSPSTRSQNEYTSSSNATSSDHMLDSEEASSPGSRWSSIDRRLRFFLLFFMAAQTLPTVWRLPPLVERHGVMFFAAYVPAMLFVAGPLLAVELYAGQFLRSMSFAIWVKLHPYLTGVAVAQFALMMYISCYFSGVAAWMIVSIFMNMQGVRPNHRCPGADPAAKDECLAAGPTAYAWFRAVLGTTAREDVLSLSFGELFQLRLVMAVVIFWVLVLFIAWGSRFLVKPLVYFTAIALFFCYAAIMVGNLSTNGMEAGNVFTPGLAIKDVDRQALGRIGFGHFFRVDWSGLASARLWLDALAHSLLSVGTLTGFAWLTASRSHFRTNFKLDAFLVIVVHLCVGLFVALAVTLGADMYARGCYVTHELALDRKIREAQLFNFLKTCDTTNRADAESRMIMGDLFAGPDPNWSPTCGWKDMQWLQKEAGDRPETADWICPMAAILEPRRRAILANPSTYSFLAISALFDSPFGLRSYRWSHFAMLAFFTLLVVAQAVQHAVNVLAAANVLYHSPHRSICCQQKFCACLCVVAVFLLFSLPFATGASQYLVLCIDRYVIPVLVVAIAFFELVFVNVFYSLDRLNFGTNFMTGAFPNLYWRVSWVILAPISLIITLVAYIIKRLLDLIRGDDEDRILSIYRVTKIEDDPFIKWDPAANASVSSLPREGIHFATITDRTHYTFRSFVAAHERMSLPAGSAWMDIVLIVVPLLWIIIIPLLFCTNTIKTPRPRHKRHSRRMSSQERVASVHPPSSSTPTSIYNRIRLPTLLPANRLSDQMQGASSCSTNFGQKSNTDTNNHVSRRTVTQEERQPFLAKRAVKLSKGGVVQFDSSRYVYGDEGQGRRRSSTASTSVAAT